MTHTGNLPRPTELDAAVYGFITVINRMPLPSNDLKPALTQHINLIMLADKIHDVYFSHWDQ